MISSTRPGKLVAIVGPTAVGKSAAAISIAQVLGDCEVVNADSMQLYAGLTIGTGKLLGGNQGGVPHHLLDIWSIDERASVAQYQQLARAQIRDIWARGRTALLVGGSGLYVSAVIDDLQFPGTVDDVRAKWEGRLADDGSHALHSQLSELDPAAAAAILPGNGRRIVRALEVIEITGRPFTAHLRPQSRHFDATVIGLELARDVLDTRIDSRVEQMWDAGWVAEVEHLRRHGLAEAPTASRALGYQQILAYLAGQSTEAEATERTKVATRRFARKQMSWFRRDEMTTWLDAQDIHLAERLVDEIGR